MELMPHQIEDAAFLASRTGVSGCFNGMGTGKTITALEACKLVNAGRVLIIGPPISLPMWLANAQNWLGVYDNVSAILKTGRTPIKPGHKVLIASYEIAVRRKDELMEWACAGHDVRSVLICDESHALKSTKAKRTKAILGSGGMVNAFTYSWMLTGTPVTRWNDDLIPFLFRASPDDVRQRIGGLSVERFNMRYCVVQKKQFPGARFPVKMTVGSRNEQELGEMLAQVATRRTLEDVWEAMPPITHTRLAIPADRSVVSDAEIERLSKMTQAEIEKEMQNNEESLSTVRRQLGLSSVPAAAAFIKERVDSGVPVVVGAWHTEVIDGLKAALDGLRVRVIDGRTSMSLREQIERDWNAGLLDVVLGQIGAMGVSLNLQKGGNNIVVVEEDWSPSVMDQFYARLHRMGQERPVHVDTLYVDTKLAKAVNAISRRKRGSHARIGDVHESAREGGAA